MQGTIGGKDQKNKKNHIQKHNKNIISRHNGKTLKTLPKKEKDIHVVLVHALWCGHCKALMPEWKNMKKKVKTDRELDAKCKVVTIEMNQQEAELPKYKEMIGNKEIEVPGYPTIFLIKNGMLHDYTGERNSGELVEWIRNSANNKDVLIHQGHGDETKQKIMGGRKTRRTRRKSSCSTCKSGFLFNLFGK